MEKQKEFFENKQANAFFADRLAKKIRHNTIFSNVSFSVNVGEIFGILGPSGCGKSTLLNVLSGMENPSSGALSVLGETGAGKIRRLTGLVPQEYSVYEELSVWDNLVYFGRLYGLSGKKIRSVGNRLLKQMFLENHRDKQVSVLSGGMKRRLNIACSLIHNPEIVLLDEPTAGLDPVTKRAIWKTLSELKGLGMTVVFTTHDMDDVEALCDRLVIMRERTLVAEGKLSQMLQDLGQVFWLRTTPGDEAELNRRLSNVSTVRYVGSKMGETLVAFTNRVVNEVNKNAVLSAAKLAGEEVVASQARRATVEDLFFVYTEKK